MGRPGVALVDPRGPPAEGADMTSTHMVLVFPLAIAVGFILPVQSAMNTRLKVSVGTTLAASFVGAGGPAVSKRGWRAS